MEYIHFAERSEGGWLDIVMEVGEKWCEEEQMEALSRAPRTRPRPRWIEGRERGGFVFLAFFPSIRRSPRFNIPDNGYKSTFRPFNLPYIHRTIHPSTSLLSRPLPHQPHPKAYIWTGWREFRPLFPTLLLDGTCHIGFVAFVSSLRCFTLSLLYLRSYQQLRLLAWDGMAILCRK